MKSDFHDASHAKRAFVFDVQPNLEGRKVLHFSYMARSDIHWGTQYSRSKRLCHMEQNTSAVINDYLGDIYDGVQVLEKKEWNLGPWHRQGMAHALRKAGQGQNVTIFQGNHEHGINRTIEHKGEQKEHRTISGKTIYDVRFRIEDDMIDAKGRSVLRLHGDKYDADVFKSEESQGFWYRLGDKAYMSLYSADRALRKVPGLEHFSLAAAGKKAVKTIINEFMGINKVVAQALDESPHDVLIYGHSHMPGFMITPKGKLLINDGCCTEHVNALVQDKNGTYALLTWHRDHIEVEEEPGPGYSQGPKYKISFEELGLIGALEPAREYKDEFTARADKMIRLLYRTWPTQDRSALVSQIRAQQDIIDRYRSRSLKGAAVEETQRAFYAEAMKARDALRAKLPPVPIARPLPEQLYPYKKWIARGPDNDNPSKPYKPPQNNKQPSWEMAL